MGYEVGLRPLGSLRFGESSNVLCAVILTTVRRKEPVTYAKFFMKFTSKLAGCRLHEVFKDYIG